MILEKTSIDTRELGDDGSPIKAICGEVIPPQRASAIEKVRGKVPGSGRKKGTPNKASVENLKTAYEHAGLSPLEVLLDGMARNRELALKLFADRDGDEKFRLDDYLKADAATRAFAAEAAPYCHSRLAPKRPEVDLPSFDLNLDLKVADSRNAREILTDRINRIATRMGNPGGG